MFILATYLYLDNSAFNRDFKKKPYSLIMRMIHNYTTVMNYICSTNVHKKLDNNHYLVGHLLSYLKKMHKKSHLYCFHGIRKNSCHIAHN